MIVWTVILKAVDSTDDWLPKDWFGKLLVHFFSFLNNILERA
jgi:hypothetical protein